MIIYSLDQEWPTQTLRNGIVTDVTVRDLVLSGANRFVMKTGQYPNLVIIPVELKDKVLTESSHLLGRINSPVTGKFPLKMYLVGIGIAFSDSRAVILAYTPEKLTT